MALMMDGKRGRLGRSPPGGLNRMEWHPIHAAEEALWPVSVSSFGTCGGNPPGPWSLLCPWTGLHTRPWLGSQQRSSPEYARASRVARDRAAPTGSGRRACVLGTAAVRVSVLQMSWLIPWSGRCDHPGRFLSFHVALQHGRLTEAERAA